MKQSLTLLGVVLVGVVVFAQQPAPNPEVAAALAKQAEIEKSAPRLQITEEILPLVVPGHTIGEAVGVAKNSKGHLFVFTRSGASGPAKGATASQLFEFDPALKFVKQWGPDNYAASFAHTVRVDKDDNVWMVDEGSNMVVKFNPEGRVVMVLGRKPEAIDYLERYTEEGHKESGTPAARTGVFNRPTDVTWDTEGNIYVADGYNNSRFTKQSKDGTWVGAVGERGAGPNQFNTVHAITNDAKGNIYVADRGNRRIQVFDPMMKPVQRVHHSRADAVPLQRRWQRQGLQDDARRQAARVGSNRARPWPERLPGAPTALRVRDRRLQGRLLDVDGCEDDHQGREHVLSVERQPDSRARESPTPGCPLAAGRYCFLTADRQTSSAVSTPSPVSSCRMVDGRNGSSATFSSNRRRVQPPRR
jgi:hypothetical protein